MRVIAAMSGGVDSSVAAARMVDAGHEVVGVHLALSRASSVPGSRGCCTLDDARDARRVADMLGIPFYVWDFSERFAEDVIDDFLDEYRAGRTPNPCLRCNERIKFAAVLDRALALDFDAVATGHYAHLIDTPDGRELHRALDPSKDQSYVLGMLDARQLRHCEFPLGGDLKDSVRAEAAERGLLTAQKPDSHDICFIPDGDTSGFLTSRLGESVGDIVDIATGEVLGQHRGAFTVTIGQRRGLNLGNPRGDGRAYYVVDTDIESNRVKVGAAADLDVIALDASRPTFAGARRDDGTHRLFAQVRAHGQPVPATVEWSGDRVRVELDEPIRGLATGQAVVLYDGDRVVGSATIDHTERAEFKAPA